MISTRSVFYYGHLIDATNYFLDFNEGGGDLVAELNLGAYTLEEYAIEIARAMTAAGGQTYSAVVDRDTRKITISATSNFSILVSSGSNSGYSTLTLAGFTGEDLSGSNSYEGNTGSGSEYRPQFLLQSYVSVDDFQEAQDAKVNTSGSGLVEVVSFGNVQFMECNITFATDINQGSGNPIETNATGVSDLRSFLQAITKKQRIEFMEDRDTTSTYVDLLLETTPTSSTGTGYRLRELYGRGLAGYYETGILKFRKV